MNNKKHIDDLFKEKLGTYAEAPPTDVWDDLDKRLDGLTPAPTQVPGGTAARWLTHFGMVSLVAVLSVVVVRKMWTDHSPVAAVATEQQAQATSPEANTAQDQAPASINDAGNTDASVTPAQQESTQATDDQQQSNATAINSTAPAGNSTGTTARQATHAGNTNTPSKPPAASKQYAANRNGTTYNKQTNDTYNSTTEETEAVANTFTTTQPVIRSTDPALALYAQAKQPQADLPQGVKKEEPKQKVAEAAKKHPLPLGFNRWEAGVKVGYERGFDNIAATKAVVSPYLQYNISKKVSIMMQPAVKYANTPVRTIGAPQSYYQVNNDGNVQAGPTTTTIKAEGGTITTYYNTRYTYTQTHDSIVKRNTIGGSYMELEMPVLFKYKVADNVSAYGGVNVVYSQVRGVKEQTFTKSGIMRLADTLVVTQSAPAAPALSDIITYTGTPYSSYTGPSYPTSQESSIRLGYMLGVSYEYSKRWLVDALIQQTPTRPDMKSGYNTNAPLSAPYFRVSVGYKLTK